MSSGVRRAIGCAAILVYLIGYVVLAATLGGMLTAAPWFLQIAFFAVAGVVWAFPLRPLFVWMGGKR